jgi:uncharacterized protein YprB with RNaseH-like and TPR domain
MDLIGKLRRFETGSGRPGAERKSRRKPDIEKHVSGTEVANASGRFFKAWRLHPDDRAHGRVFLGRLFDIPSHVFELAGKDSALSGLDAAKTVFLDTETTGLAGGTGTVPFLVGLGWFEGGVFRVEQFFMRDYDEEKAVLSALHEALEPFQYLVSYNGKAFDVSLLSTRFTLARMRNPLEGVPHLDLLHTARRLWKRRLADCTLTSVEREIVGFVRENDVPGFVIPHLYFEYLRTGNAEPLAGVFRHNQWDILTLAALAVLTGQIFDKPHDHLDHPLDFLSLARAMENRFRYGEAAACYCTALDHPLEPEEKEEALFRLGLVWKRLGHWDKAVGVWENAISNQPFSVAPYEELAKYHEHRMQDFAKALSWTERALERVTLLGDLRSDLSVDEDRRDLEIRLNRLKRKLQAAS